MRFSGLIFATSSAQSQPLSDNEIATDLSHDTIDLPVSNNTAASAVHSPISQGKLSFYIIVILDGHRITVLCFD